MSGPVPAPILWRNARLLPCDGVTQRLDSAALISRGARLDWVGRERDLPEALRAECAEIRDLGGAWVTPGLIDCHTHLVFAGSRAIEYAQRLRGVSYEEIAAPGRRHPEYRADTRLASEEQLFDQSAARLAVAGGRRRDHGGDQVRLWPDLGR